MKTKLLVLFFVLFSQTTFADFDAALDAYAAEDFKIAFAEFEQMAKMGEKRSQFNLGVMYLKGQHVEQDLNHAYAWLKLAKQGEGIDDNHKKVFDMVANKLTDTTEAESIYQSLFERYSGKALISKLYPVIVESTDSHAFEAIPIKISEAKYPFKALKNDINGKVTFNLDVDQQGFPRNITVVDYEPVDMVEFARNSLKSIKRWRFKPATDDAGSPVYQSNLRFEMDFKIAGREMLIEQEVFNETQSKALQGDAQAQFVMGYWAKSELKHVDIGHPNDWFLKSAIQGYSPAQFQIGQNLIQGKGCLIDKAKGIEWLARAATNNQPDAKEMLAIIKAAEKSQGAQLQAVEYFSGVKKLSAKAQLAYAKLLATSPFDDVANSAKAREVVDSISKEVYWDPITKLEIIAASYAREGNFEEAIDYQEEAVEEAEDWKADSSEAQARLKAYKSKTLWFLASN